MRIALGLSVLLFGLAIDPAAASDAKLERLGELIDLKKADISTISVRNKTGLCVDVTVVGDDLSGEIQEEVVEPEGVATIELELIETTTFVVSANSCDSSLCEGDSLIIDLEPGATVELCVTQSTGGGEEGEGGCELNISEDNGGEETVSLTREAVVLTCSSSGLFALACVGFFLGRAPRRREEELLQQE